MITWSARSYPSLDMRTAAYNAKLAKKDIDSLYAAADTAKGDAEGVANAAAYAVTHAYSGDNEYALDLLKVESKSFLGQVEDDLDWLRQHDHLTPAYATRNLLNRPLWTTDPPNAWGDTWSKIKTALLEKEPGFNVWTEWYDRRIRGERSAFDIPGDQRDKEDEWLLREIADASDEDFWDRGPEYVNRQLAEWLEEARERAAENLKPVERNTGHNSLPHTLKAAASPQAAERDGKLDAGPNAEFDKPTYNGDLADLPATMRAFIKVLRNSLGRNASAFMKSSLEGYEEELLVRGTQPILGTLKGLSQAIAREVWTSESLAASDDPGDWELRDEREWGPGMADLFRTFAQYNADLIKHFPLDEKREELLRETPINEIAASGDALISPVLHVTDGVRELHAEGFATDEIVKIMDAHAQYNADIASLPPPDPSLPEDYVTPKRRHVLMTAGFYLHLYGVLGSTASLTGVVQANPNLMTQLQAAIDVLLSFVL